MKKKIFLFVAIIATLMCFMAISVSAATPDTTKETVILSDGTKCPIWDTDGDALIWYVSTDNLDDGYEKYDYIEAQDSRVTYEANGIWSAYGSEYNQIRYIKIDGVDGQTNIVVLNINDDDVKVTSDKAKDGLVNGFEFTFQNSAVLEYAYLHTSTVAIQKQAFCNCQKLSYVNFTELTNLKQVQQQAFWCCYNLFANQTLDLSKTQINGIGTGAFAANSTTETMQYTTLIFPSTLKEWFNGGYPFQYCANLTTVEGLENTNITSLPGSIFKHCPKLESITLPSSLTSIGEYAFAFNSPLSDNTTNLKITIPANVTAINNKAFQNNTSLVEINFAGTSIKAIDNPAFENCKRLPSVVLPEGLETIGNCIFNGCSSLKSVTLPSTLTTVNGNNNFYNCTALETVIGLENTKLTKISEAMFRGVKNWKPDVVKLPHTVTSIEQYGFADCGMKSIVLSPQMTKIGTEAFVNCANLEAVYIPSTITEIASNSFNNNQRSDIIFFVTSEDATYLETIKTGVGASSIVTYTTYSTNGQDYSKGKYVISGYNVCDAFYEGDHDIINDDGLCSTETLCAREGCGKVAIKAQVHNLIIKITYNDGFNAAGVKICDCPNENCTKEDSVTEAAPIFTANGYSVREDGKALLGGYTIDTEALKAYNLYNNTKLTYGIVMSNAANVQFDENNAYIGGK
ncbi:MAG: leucine-rich repeat domain-containing protein, partial [Clostridia bacterium]|nr:leucine-rich repeat domain-containing protein [Clostridia bacterium]